VGGKFAFADDPVEMARLMIAHIDRKRKDLNLAPVMYGQESTKNEEAKV